MIRVSWNDAQTYVKWLSRITGNTYRLLSEAEYEYATRAGSETAYPWGPKIDLDGKPMANCRGCGGEWGGRRTAPFNSFPANALVSTKWSGMCGSGLRTVGTRTTRRAKGRLGMDDGLQARVVRGGSWFDDPEHVRSAGRDGSPPSAG